MTEMFHAIFKKPRLAKLYIPEEVALGQAPEELISIDVCTTNILGRRCLTSRAPVCCVLCCVPQEHKCDLIVRLIAAPRSSDKTVVSVIQCANHRNGKHMFSVILRKEGLYQVDVQYRNEPVLCVTDTGQEPFIVVKPPPLDPMQCLCKILQPLETIVVAGTVLEAEITLINVRGELYNMENSSLYVSMGHDGSEVFKITSSRNTVKTVLKRSGQVQIKFCLNSFGKRIPLGNITRKIKIEPGEPQELIFSNNAFIGESNKIIACNKDKSYSGELYRVQLLSLQDKFSNIIWDGHSDMDKKILDKLNFEIAQSGPPFSVMQSPVLLRNRKATELCTQFKKPGKFVVIARFQSTLLHHYIVDVCKAQARSIRLSISTEIKKQLIPPAQCQARGQLFKIVAGKEFTLNVSAKDIFNKSCDQEVLQKLQHCLTPAVLPKTNSLSYKPWLLSKYCETHMLTTTVSVTEVKPEYSLYVVAHDVDNSERQLTTNTVTFSVEPGDPQELKVSQKALVGDKISTECSKDKSYSGETYRVALLSLHDKYSNIIWNAQSQWDMDIPNQIRLEINQIGSHSNAMQRPVIVRNGYSCDLCTRFDKPGKYEVMAHFQSVVLLQYTVTVVIAPLDSIFLTLNTDVTCTQEKLTFTTACKIRRSTCTIVSGKDFRLLVSANNIFNKPCDQEIWQNLRLATTLSPTDPFFSPKYWSPLKIGETHYRTTIAAVTKQNKMYRLFVLGHYVGNKDTDTPSNFFTTNTVTFSVVPRAAHTLEFNLKTACLNTLERIAEIEYTGVKYKIEIRKAFDEFNDDMAVPDDMSIELVPSDDGDRAQKLEGHCNFEIKLLSEKTYHVIFKQNGRVLSHSLQTVSVKNPCTKADPNRKPQELKPNQFRVLKVDSQEELYLSNWEPFQDEWCILSSEHDVHTVSCSHTCMYHANFRTIAGEDLVYLSNIYRATGIYIDKKYITVYDSHAEIVFESDEREKAETVQYMICLILKGLYYSKVGYDHDRMRRHFRDASQKAFKTNDFSHGTPGLLSEIKRNYADFMESARNNSRDAYFKFHNLNRPLCEIDLHNMRAYQNKEKKTPGEAVDMLKQRMRDPDLVDNYEWLEIIVGAGIHSEKGQLIRPAVEAFLKKDADSYEIYRRAGSRYDVTNKGALLITFKEYEGPEPCYGQFYCVACDKVWWSKYAWKGYRQTCFECETWKSLPYKLSSRPNKSKRPPGQRRGRGPPPHEERLCDKCLELGYSCIQKRMTRGRFEDFVDEEDY